MSWETETADERPACVLAKPVRNTLAGSGLARAKKGNQRHVLAVSETKTLCGIDTTSWAEKVVVEDETTTNCPYCATALEEAAKAAKAGE